MADLSSEAFDAFIAAAADRLQGIRPELTREEAEGFAAAAVPPMAMDTPGMIALANPTSGKTLFLRLEDFDPYQILEALDG